METSSLIFLFESRSAGFTRREDGDKPRQKKVTHGDCIPDGGVEKGTESVFREEEENQQRLLCLFAVVPAHFLVKAINPHSSCIFQQNETN